MKISFSFKGCFFFNNVLNLNDYEFNIVEYIFVYREFCVECLEGKFNRIVDIYRYVVIVYRFFGSCFLDIACAIFRFY